MTKAQVIALIDQYITTNGNEEITGAQTNSVMKALANQDIPFGDIINKPTTLSGYGITDAYTKGVSDGRYFRSDIADTKNGTANFNGQVNIRNVAIFSEDGIRGVNILTNSTDGASIGTYTYHDFLLKRGDDTKLTLTSSGVVINGTVTGSNLSGTNTGDQTLSGLGGEPAFSKNTAFNKNFGTSSGTVMQGDAAYTKSESNSRYFRSDIADTKNGTANFNGDVNIRSEAKFTQDGIRGVNILTNSTDGASIGTYTSHDFLLKRGNSTKLTLTSSGVVVDGTVTATGFYESSDRRLKKNIQPLNYGLREIEKIDTHTWNWKKDGSEDMGVIAQELELIMPELVKTNKEGYKSVNYTKLVPILINSIKELSNQVKALKNG